MKPNKQTAQLIADEVFEMDRDTNCHFRDFIGEIKRILDERDAAEVHSISLEDLPGELQRVQVWSVYRKQWEVAWIMSNCWYSEKSGEYHSGVYSEVYKDGVAEVKVMFFSHWRHMPAPPREDGEL